MKDDALVTPVGRLLFIRGNALVRGAKPGSAVLEELLTGLQVPASLKGGMRVASQACRLLRGSLPTQQPEARPKIREYICELRWVIRKAKELSDLLFYSKEERQRFLACNGGNPFVSDGAVDHGLCCLLWEKYRKCAAKADDRRSNLRVHYDAMRQEALLIHIAAIGHWAQREDWSSPGGHGQIVRESMYRRTLAIRHFMMNRYRANTAYREALTKIPLNASRVDLWTALQQIRRDIPETSDKLAEQLKKDIASILGLLKVADKPDSLRAYTKEAEAEISVKEPPAPQVPSNEGTYQVEYHEEEDETEEEEEEEEEDEANDVGDEGDAKGAIYTRSRWSEEEKRACVEAGVNPADVLSAEKLYLSKRRSGDSKAWQAMRNQNLSSAGRNLVVEELAIGLQILQSQMNRSVVDLEIFALARTILARGLTLKSAKSILVLGVRPSEVTQLTLILPDCETEHDEWLLPAVPIPFEQEHGAYEGCRQVQKFYFTPDYWGIGSLLRPLLAMKFPGWNGEPLQPFAKPLRVKMNPTYSRRLKDALEHANSDRGPGLAGRMTFARLGRVLRQRIYDQTSGDLVLVTYVSMQKDHAGEDGRFYATPAVRSVQQAELAAVSAIDAELRSIGYDPRVNVMLEPSDSSGYLGSPMCPTLEAVELFLANQFGIIAATNRTLNTGEEIDAIIARHNAFTLLTFCAATIGTLHRPNHGGIPDLSSIETSRGLVSLADKGSAKARLGVAADAAVTQLKAYRAYVQTFEFERVFGVRPELPFFFICPDKDFVPVSPATLTQQSLPFVANFARHLAKTILCEWCEAGDERISQEWIAALLGHFVEGEEQFGPYSGFDYKSFAHSMRAALGTLLTKVKFHPIDIRGRRIIVHAHNIQRFLETTED